MLRNSNSTDNTDSTINTNDAETCGSGKKTKNYCAQKGLKLTLLEIELIS